MKPETTIENIRSMLANSTLTSPEKMQELADSFNDTAAVFNRRMQTCAELIKAGNSAEAVRLADEHPRLLDLYTLLNFDELDDWYAATTQFTDTIPVPLNTEHYQLLNGAYTHAASLDSLFRQYRLANLTDAPLREKLPVLRSIAEKDAGNFFWLEDVEQFEKVRQNELKNEIKTASAAKNQRQLDAIYWEIKEQPWRVSPQNLIAQILLPVLSARAAKLLDYCNNYNFDAVGNAYQELQNMLSTENIAAPPMVSNALSQARTLLADVEKRRQMENRKQQFIAARNALESALSRRSSAEELRQLYSQLAAFALPIPKDLTVRFENRVTALDDDKQAKDTKKALLFIGAFIAAVVVLLSFVVILQLLK